jgi:hypothetical protein
MTSLMVWGYPWWLQQLYSQHMWVPSLPPFNHISVALVHAIWGDSRLNLLTGKLLFKFKQCTCCESIWVSYD